MGYYSKRVNMFNRTELLAEADSARYTSAREILEENRIKFEVRAKAFRPGRNPRKDAFVGMRYTIYVRKEDYETAKKLIG